MDTEPYDVELGDTLIDTDILDSLEKLWEGDLTPDDLHDIELGIRALLTGKRLISPPDKVSVPEGLFGDPLQYRAALSGTCLQYEFVDPGKRSPQLVDLQRAESQYLEKVVLGALTAMAPTVCALHPSTMSRAAEILRAQILGRSERFAEDSEDEICTDFLGYDYIEPVQVDGYLDHPKSWISEESVEDDAAVREVDPRARNRGFGSDEERALDARREKGEADRHTWLKRVLINHHETKSKPFSRDTFTQSHEFHYLAADTSRDFARYFIACHRTGLTVYANSPIGRICNRFIFSDWPRKLFEGFDETYKAASRQLRAPGISVDLPPMLALVLSRVGTRDAIPELLREMRGEYAQARDDLWLILREMWTADRYELQLESLRRLQSAADSIYSAAFPERMNRLSLGLGLATASLNDVGKKLLEHDQPMARVAAVSMAARLTHDLRKLLGNQGASLRHHLTRSERQAFGID